MCARARARVREVSGAEWYGGTEYRGGKRMAEPVRKPDIRELYGAAVNASALTMAEGRETPLDRVAAMGAAQLAVASGAARQGLTVAAVQPEVEKRARAGRPGIATSLSLRERDALEAELSGSLWHLRYGEQISMVPMVATLFATWLCRLDRFKDQPAPLMHKFATRALDEWLSGKCQKCGGSKKNERSKLTGSLIKPTGSGARNAVFEPCNECHGSGRALPSHPLRMRLLGLTREQYEGGMWFAHFKAAQAWLSKHLSPRVHRPLTAQLERRKRRS